MHAAGDEAFDRARRAIFLEKADIDLDDALVSALRARSDADLGIDEGFLARARSAFELPDGSAVRAERQGTFHRIYDVASPGTPARCLRIAALRGAESARAMELEARVIDGVIASGIAAPRCAFRVVADRGDVRGVHLIDRARGVAAASLDDDEPRAQEALRRMGRFLARLHALHGSGFGPLACASANGAGPLVPRGVHARWDDFVLLNSDRHVAACVESGAITTREAERITAQFAVHAPALRAVHVASLLHGDPGSHNFIVAGDAADMAIDWEDALLGDPLFELASACAFHPERRHAALFGGYGHSLSGEERSRFWLYFLRIALARTVHRCRFGYADRPNRPPASSRIGFALRRLEEAH